MMAFVHRKYDKIIKDIPLVEYIPREVLALLQFFTGFLQFPFCIPLWIISIIQRRKIKILQRQVEEKKKIMELFNQAKQIITEHNNKKQQS